MHIGILTLAILSGALAQAQTWVSSSNGSIPANAVVGGFDEQAGQSLYICRTTYQNASTIGKTAGFLGSCRFEWFGQGVQVASGYEVLTNFSVAWRNSTGVIPDGSYNAATSGTMYICRASVENGTQVGKTAGTACYLEYDGGGLAITNFQVLWEPWVTQSGTGVPSGSLQTGTDLGGVPLYTCRVLVGNNHQIGKVKSGTNCHYNNGGAYQFSSNYQVLAEATAAWNPGLNGSAPTAFYGGNASSSLTKVVCRASVSGTTTPGQLTGSACLFEYADGPQSNTNYQVLDLPSTVNTACGSTLGSSSMNAAAAGQTGQTSVTMTASDCGWYAKTNAVWITITNNPNASPSTAFSFGTGTGTVAFAVAANTSTTPRSGTLTINGKTFTINQAGFACTYSLSAPGVSVPVGGGTTSVNLTTNASGCAWTASAPDSWATITSSPSGTGNATITLSVQPNPNASSRSSIIVIAQQSFTVTQAGASCTYSLSAPGATVPATGGTASVNVTTNGPSCAWTASAPDAWATITAGGSGSGNGTVNLNIQANPNATQRVSTLTIAGQSFTITQTAAPCSLSLSAPGVTVPIAGGSTSVNVIANGSTCTWTASAPDTWATITAGATGSGNGTVNISTQANPNAAQRTSTLTIAGQTFTITQTAAPCSLSLSAPGVTVPIAGGSTSVNVIANGSTCTWTASAPDTWASITAGVTGSGNGTVNISAQANPNATQRTSTLTIAGQSFTVTQPALGCTFSLSANSNPMPAAAGTGSVNVTAPGGCAWTVIAPDAWVTITSGTAGSGNGTVNFSVQANPNAAQRTSALTIGGQPFNIVQAAAACSYSLSAPAASAAATASTGSVNVITNGSTCAWTASAPDAWTAITAGASGTGNGTVNFSLQANPNASQRASTLTIAGGSFTITQAAASCTFSLSSPGASPGAPGGSASVNVLTNGPTCAWTSSAPDVWATIATGATGSGNGTVSIAVQANPNASPRVSTLTIAGQTFTVTQSAVGCTFSISAPGASAPAGGGTGSVNVVAPSGCAWTVIVPDAWTTITSGASGSGNGTVNYSTQANPNATQRVSTLTIAGQSFTITQAAANCTFSLSPGSASLPATSGSGSTAVTAISGCSWTAVSNAAWVTITSGTSGSGNGTVNYTVAANATGAPRSGSLTIAGQTFSVNQESGSCTFSLNPASPISLPSGAGSGTIAVSTAPGCTWQTTSSVPWITITSGASGNGPGNLVYSFQANSGASRTGNITIGGQTITLNQGAGCTTFTINPASQVLSAAGGSATLDVTAPVGCTWTAVSNSPFVTIYAVSGGPGNGTVSYTVAPNAGQQRVGTLTVAGQTATVTQSGSNCNYSLSASNLSFPAAGGTGTLTVSSATGCSWIAASDAPWVLISGSSFGSGGGTLSFSVAANSGIAPRSATISVSGQTYLLTQTGSGCIPTVTTSTQSFGANGGASTATVILNSGCAWTATSNVPWIRVTNGASGSGGGSVSFSVDPIASITARAGVLRVANQSFLITQKNLTGCVANVQVTERTFTFDAAGGAGSLRWPRSGDGGELLPGCPTTIRSTSVPWITLAPVDDNQIDFRVAPSDGLLRTGTIAIDGNLFTITQTTGEAACGQPFLRGSAFDSSGGRAKIENSGDPTGFGELGGPCSAFEWSAATDVPWIHFTGTPVRWSTNGFSDPIEFQLDANSGIARTGRIFAGGRTFPITQEAPGSVTCTSWVPNQTSFSGDGGSLQQEFGELTRCNVVTNVPWISSQGLVGPNDGAPRSAEVRIAGEAYTIRQDTRGVQCNFQGIGPSPDTFPASGGTGRLWDATSCPAEVSTPTSWIRHDGSGGITVDINPSSQPRSGTIVVNGTSFPIHQLASSCINSFSPSSISLPGSRGNGEVALDGHDNCQYFITSVPSWLVAAPLAFFGGSEVQGQPPPTFTYRVEGNTANASRSGTIVVNGTPIPVTQDSGDCTNFSFAQLSVLLTSEAATGSFPVANPNGCALTAATASPFVTVSVVNKVVTYTVTANQSLTSRSATVVVNGVQFNILQLGNLATAVNCSLASAPTPATLRSLGRTERLAPLNFNCQGRSGGLSFSADVLVTLNVNLTNRILQGTPGTLDATLRVNGGQAIKGTLEASNAIRFADVPFSSGEPEFNASLAVENLRADVSTQGTSNSGFAVQATVSILTPLTQPPPMSVTVGNSRPAVALSRSASTAVGNRLVLPVTLQEGFPNAFLTRSQEQGDTATRLMLRIAGVPTGATLMAAVSSADTSARLVSADANGNGGQYVSPTSDNFAPVALVNGAATIAYEMLTSDLTLPESLSLQLLAGGVTQAQADQIRIVALLGPLNGAANADLTAPVPRFADPNASGDVVNLQITTSAPGVGSRPLSIHDKPGVQRAAVAAGSSATFVHTVVNNSDKTATNVVVRNTLPVGLSNPICTPSCTVEGRVLRFNLGTMAPGARSTLTVTATVSPVISCPTCLGNGSLLQNVVTVSSSESDSSLANNTVRTEVQVTDACQFTLGRGLLTAPAGATTLLADVITGPSCDWTAPASQNGITVTPAGALRGSTTLRLAIGANPTATARNLAMVIQNQNLTIAQAGSACSITFGASQVSVPAPGGDVTVDVRAAAGCNWQAVSAPNWLRIASAATGSGNQTIRLNALPNSLGVQRAGVLEVSGQTLPVVQLATGAVTNCTFRLSSSTATHPAPGGSGSVNLNAATGCGWSASSTSPWINVSNGVGSFNYSLKPNTGPARSGVILAGGQAFTIQQAAQDSVSTTGLKFVPLDPCRVLETRPEYNFQGRTGAFGPPALTRAEMRTLNLPQSTVCQIPATAKAYVLNVTLIPRNGAGVDFATVYPAGESRPAFWTVRSPDAQIVANAAIVKAGTNGGITVYSSDSTDMIIDISGYFTDDANTQGYTYYPLTPCRVLDTRILYRAPVGPFGPPTMNAGERRSFALPQATQYCQVPAGAKAYSITITVAPPAALQFLTAWPTGGSQPNVSSINSPAGRTLANSVILPASAAGSIDAFVYERSDVLLDITGYFAPDNGQGLFYFPVTQCRASDSQFSDEQAKTISVASCGVPATAKGYAANVTSISAGSPMPFLTLYPTGQSRPNASTLNAFEGQTITNSTIVPSGTNAAIDVFAYRRTQVVLEISGYFGR